MIIIIINSITIIIIASTPAQSFECVQVIKLQVIQCGCHRAINYSLTKFPCDIFKTNNGQLTDSKIRILCPNYLLQFYDSIQCHDL